MKASYGHAPGLLNTCSRGCDRAAVCVSDRDQKEVCVICAIREERETANAS